MKESIKLSSSSSSSFTMNCMKNINIGGANKNPKKQKRSLQNKCRFNIHI